MIEKDTPLNCISGDLLNRQHMVNLLADVLKESSKSDHDCFCIGIYGKWGEGKTSFMNFMEQNLLENGNNDNLVIVHFNPWIANSEEAMLQDFFHTISVDTLGDVKKILQQYGGVIALSAKAVAKTVAIPAAVESGNAYMVPVINKCINKFDSVWNKSKDAVCSIKEKSLAEQKKKISNEIVKSKKHLLIFIDDIDRLDRDEIHTVLRLIRQVADFKNTMYVVAMDPDIVAKSLSTFFGHGDIVDGRNFIDKIIQFPFQLPTILPSTFYCIIENKISELWIKYDCGSAEDIKEVCTTLSSLFTTMRQVIRFFNQLRLIFPVVCGEVNAKQFCYLLAIKTLDNQAYLRIVEHKSALFKEADSVMEHIDPENEDKAVKQRFEDALDDIVKDLDDGVRLKVRDVIDNLFSTSYLYENQLDGKCINTAPYFMRYFMLDVPYNIISDRECIVLYNKWNYLSENDLLKWIETHFDNYDYSEVQRVITKIIRMQNDLPMRCKMTERFIKVLSRCSLCDLYGYYLLTIPDLTIFIHYVLLKQYMFEDLSSGQPAVRDEERIYSTLQGVYQKSKLEFCLHLHSQIFRNDSFKSYDFTQPLIDRFKSLTYTEQLKYSRGILWPFFLAWHRIDESGPIVYLNNALYDSDFKVEAFLEKLVDVHLKEKDVVNFIIVFGESSKNLVSYLHNHGVTAETCPYINYILSNYGSVMKERK